jgi:spermidine synthase
MNVGEDRSHWAGSAPGEPVVQAHDGVLTLRFDSSAVQSSMDPDRPHELLLEYSHIMMGALLFAPAPRHIGMIGMGGGSLLKACRHLFPQALISVAEISPEVLALRERFRIPPDDDHLVTDCADGAEWVTRQDTAFDVLMVDGFDIHGQAPALCTQRFYDDCADALGAHGVLVINMHTIDALHGAYVERVCRSFANSVSVVATRDSDNQIVFAARGNGFRLSEKQLSTRARALGERLGIDLLWLAHALIAGRQRDRATPQHRHARRVREAGE